MQQTVKAYYQLAKPGIIYGNLIAALAGFFLASKGSIKPGPLLTTLAGIAFVIGAACVCNNYIDRGIDARMNRTKKRATVTGTIAGRNVIAYAVTLAILGFAILAVYTNAITVILGAIAVVTYVVLYGIAKRTTSLGTIVGSIAGALPPAGGYTAVSGNFDAGAALLFLAIVFWQMPHFYAIAIYRLKDYTAAGLPVLPVKQGIAATKRQIIAYIVAFIIVSSLLTVYHYATVGYLIVMLALGGTWLVRSLRGYGGSDAASWARKLFLFSLIVMLGWSITICIDSFFV